MVTVSSVLANLDHDRQMARKHHQYAVSKACTELQGRYLAMFTDKTLTEDVNKTRELSEHEKEEAKRIAEIRLHPVASEDVRSA